MTKKEMVKDYLDGKNLNNVIKGIFTDGNKNEKKDIGDADFIIYKTEGMFNRPADRYPQIRSEKDLRRMLPLVDYDPLFDIISDNARKIRDHFGNDICIFYEVSSPLRILLKHLYGTDQLKSVPQYMKDNPYSFLLALDTICVDCINAATRVILEGKMDGIWFDCFNSCVFSDGDFERYIKPVETHFFDEVNKLSRYNILAIGNRNNPVNELKYYQDYPVKIIMDEYDKLQLIKDIFHEKDLIMTSENDLLKIEYNF